jgi:hypothetical protein
MSDKRIKLADKLANAARAIEAEYINGKGTDSAFASCMTEVSCFTRNKGGRAMWKKWERFMAALDNYAEGR